MHPPPSRTQHTLKPIPHSRTDAAPELKQVPTSHDASARMQVQNKPMATSPSISTGTGLQPVQWTSTPTCKELCLIHPELLATSTRPFHHPQQYDVMAYSFHAVTHDPVTPPHKRTSPHATEHSLKSAGLRVAVLEKPPPKHATSQLTADTNTFTTVADDARNTLPLLPATNPNTLLNENQSTLDNPLIAPSKQSLSKITRSPSLSLDACAFAIDNRLESQEMVITRTTGQPVMEARHAPPLDRRGDGFVARSARTVRTTHSP